MCQVLAEAKHSIVYPVCVLEEIFDTYANKRWIKSKDPRIQWYVLSVGINVTPIKIKNFKIQLHNARVSFFLKPDTRYYNSKIITGNLNSILISYLFSVEHCKEKSCNIDCHILKSSDTFEEMYN